MSLWQHQKIIMDAYRVAPQSLAAEIERVCDLIIEMGKQEAPEAQIEIQQEYSRILNLRFQDREAFKSELFSELNRAEPAVKEVALISELIDENDGTSPA